MATASYYKGLTIEFDLEGLKLLIEGQYIPIQQQDQDFCSVENPNICARDLLSLAKLVVDHSPEYAMRKTIQQQHLNKLDQGIDAWNRWRRGSPHIRPTLYDSDLRGRDLAYINFSNADLRNARLDGCRLSHVNFHEANLGGASLQYADLEQANFCRTDLYKSDLSYANLLHANLQGTQLAMTRFTGAKLIGCRIYGLSAWDLDLKGAIQRDLNIVYRNTFSNYTEFDETSYSNLVVDDIQVAQFIYLLLHNHQIREAIDTLTSKVVLILGRFSDDRKEILQHLKDALRNLGYVPVLFDFEKPCNRNFIETVSALAHLSRFVIADVTDPKLVIQEIPHIVKNVAVPLQPILLESEEPELITLLDLRRNHRSLLPTHVYADWEDLRAQLEDKIIQPAEALFRDLL